MILLCSPESQRLVGAQQESQRLVGQVIITLLVPVYPTSSNALLTECRECNHYIPESSRTA